MGHVVDPLLFRLKIIKFWFVLGFSNKKFYNYLISFQSYFLNFIMNFIYDDFFLNKVNFFLGSIRLVQIYNFIYILLFVRFDCIIEDNRKKYLKISLNKKLFYLKKKTFLNKSYIKFLELFNNNFITNLSYSLVNKKNKIKSFNKVENYQVNLKFLKVF